ncbi:MAG: ABC transporter ATP-binding protein [Promethearchaeota archaeon]
MESVIKVENLSKVFYNKKSKSEEESEIWALNNVSFEVKQGEIFGLLGPNGAGKTTAIRCIAGLLKPHAGNILVNGENLKKQEHSLRKNMGFLTENHGNYEYLSVHDNLRFFGSFYDIEPGELEKRIDSVLQEIDLIKRKDMKAGKLSKGQKQRLAIARALLHDPQILFFDEPTSGLDPIASVKVRDLILSLKKKHRTLFINSHNLEEVQKICDRVAILDLGQIKRIGTPSELRNDLFKTQEMVCTLVSPVSKEIQEKISRLNYIDQYRIDDNKIYFYSRDADETTPLIVKELVDSNARILEINRTIHSLEDIYLKLMQNQQE